MPPMKKSGAKSSRSIPRILRINRIDKKKLLVSVLFSTGENRLLDFNHILKHVWQVKKSDLDYPLLTPDIFAKMKLEGQTLQWKYMKSNSKSAREHEFGVGSDTLYELSEPDHQRNLMIGKMFKEARLKAGKTQEEVAVLSGTSRTYITRLESDKQDIELMTLKKLIEAGLNMRLRVSID
jgi:DNA-binding XRE family transcriptional regulator